MNYVTEIVRDEVLKLNSKSYTTEELNRVKHRVKQLFIDAAAFRACDIDDVLFIADGNKIKRVLLIRTIDITE